MIIPFTSWRGFFYDNLLTKYMRKVLEDLLTEDTAQSIDIYWDGQPVTFWHNVELENELFADIKGRVDYTYSYEEETNSTRMTWVNVTIESLSLEKYEDG